MKLHEYQSKQLFKEYGLPVSESRIADSPEEAAKACGELGGDTWVVKVQVHAGGRGKAGGVRLVKSPEEAAAFAAEWLGKRLVTVQTDDEGQPVNRILVETCTDIARELYFSLLLDRTAERISVIVSAEGGVEIEEVAAKTPERILRVQIDPVAGAQPWQGRQLAFQMGLQGAQVRQFADILCRLVRLFEEKDLALLEINPLVITDGGDLHCLDAKVEVDSNALYRQKDLEAQRDVSQEHAAEVEAEAEQLSYISLQGEVGCMVNGAGLAMATMDLIQIMGGRPANFLDVGGRSDAERVAKAFGIILSDKQVRSVLINIFGGIVRCDVIAEGILQAALQMGVSVPIVVRLEGNRAEEGRQLLQGGNLPEGVRVLSATSLRQAVQMAIEEAK